MKKSLLLLFIGLCIVLAYGQNRKPCGTAMLAKRHQKTQSAKTRQAAQEEIRHYEGEKKGLIILVEFPDIPFSSEDPLQTWSDIANKQGYADNGAIGSVGDYFYDQSYGKFRLKFDVVGPVMAAHSHEYYGDNVDFGYGFWFDKNIGELLEEPCKGVADKVNYADYDWEGDGEVDQVFLLYAGHGEADYYSKDTTVIWPHMASLMAEWEGYENGIIIQDKRINVYACSNELDWNNKFTGMGTICHEFSHCLGLPDLYNTMTSDDPVGSYDLMASGMYNGNGWYPPGYSSYERYVCGWLTPEPVDDPASITSLLPLLENPDARIYRTSADANDYYLIEYRKKESWDTYLWGSKAVIGTKLAWHIDYDPEAWANNVVNNDPDHLRVEWMLLSKIPTSISDISSEDKSIIGVYDLQGRPADSSQSGILIVRYSDGASRIIIR